MDAKGTLEYTKITDALQLLGSRFFGEVQGTSKTGSRTKTYDVNFVDEPEEQAHVSEIEEFMTIPSEFSDDQAIEVFLAEGDEDALVMQQFEEALVETLQGDPDIAACLNTYVEARKKLQDKARSRGFWSSGKNFNKGKPSSLPVCHLKTTCLHIVLHVEQHKRRRFRQISGWCCRWHVQIARICVQSWIVPKHHPMY